MDFELKPSLTGLQVGRSFNVSQYRLKGSEFDHAKAPMLLAPRVRFASDCPACR